ncbi:Gfo/Idh/MocA family protein [Caulobacter segnis]
MEPMSKRTFLAAGLAAGVAALPRGGLAAEPGRKLGYAILGLGYYATRIIMPRFAECEHSKLVALVSGTPEKLKTFGEQYGIPESHRYSYETFDRIADNPDVDIVYVITPNSLHRTFTERAAKAGKHVMCEKPMATSAADCEAMIAACKKAGRKLMIGYRSRFQAHNIEAIKLIRDGAIGPVRSILDRPRLHDRRSHAAAAEEGAVGGGSLMDIGIYSLNAARYLTGEEPVAVNAMESHRPFEPALQGGGGHHQLPAPVPVGRDGAVWFSLHRQLQPLSGQWTQGLDRPGSGHSSPGPVDAGLAEWPDRPARAGAAADEPVLGPTGPPVRMHPDRSRADQPGEEGLKDLRVIEAIYRAAREGRTVKV